MQNNKRLSSRFLIIGISILIVSVILIVFAVFWIDNKAYKLNPQNNKTVPVSLLGYNDLKQQISKTLASDSSTYKSDTSFRINKSLLVLENNSAADKVRYDEIIKITTYVSTAYSNTRNPSYRKLYSKIGDFIKLNFSKINNQNIFELMCQDLTCAEAEQPNEIIAVLDTIKNSDFPEYIKSMLINNITDTSFMPNKYRKIKASLYYQDLLDLQKYSEFSKTGVNQKIYNQLSAYVEKEYPQELKEIKAEIPKKVNIKKIPLGITGSSTP